MLVRSWLAGLEVLAPAKLNLFLEVIGKRSDGFHEVETLMVPIGLYDSLYFSSLAGGTIRLTCEQVPAGRGHADMAGETLPGGSENIIVRAVELLRRHAGVTFGAHVHLTKRIPLAAGLAGGSSDAAAALWAANRGWGLDWPRERLIPLAAELGSDVPFFLGCGPAICRGRGERIESVAGLGSLWFVVVKPPAGLSTADVYRGCRPAAKALGARSLIESLRSGHTALAGQLLHNRLQPAAQRLSPWIERLKDLFAEFDFLGHAMSGSGTSYFGLCRHACHARRLAARLQARGVGRIYAVHSCC